MMMTSKIYLLFLLLLFNIIVLDVTINDNIL
jgi:hypothetical protein